MQQVYWISWRKGFMYRILPVKMQTVEERQSTMTRLHKCNVLCKSKNISPMIIIISERKKTSEPFWMQVPRSDLPFRWHYYLLCVLPSNNAAVQTPNENIVFSCLLRMEFCCVAHSATPPILPDIKGESFSHFWSSVASHRQLSSLLIQALSLFFSKNTSPKLLDTFFCLAHFDLNFIIFQRRFNYETHRNFYQRVFIPGRIDTGRSSLLAATQNIHLQGELT